MGEYDIDDENDTSVSDYDVEKIIIIHDQYTTDKTKWYWFDLFTRRGGL